MTENQLKSWCLAPMKFWEGIGIDMFTTLKALKWAHDLGIRQERVRVASHLQVRAQAARVANDIFNNMINEEMSKSKPNKKNLERLDFDRAVYARVNEIIDEMFNPHGEWIAPPSFMFPDDDHKGEVK
jgi:hypothetical protein